MTTITNSINNTIGASNSGVTNTLTVQNTSNTASSQAQILTTVGGTTAGDVWNQWTVGTTRSYAIGIDNSDSQKLKLAMAAAATVDPSSGTALLSIDPGANGNIVFTPQGTGNVVVGTGTPTVEIAPDVINFAVCQSVNGGTLGAEIFNTDNSSTASRSALNIRVGGTSAGDATLSWIVNSGSTWTSGVDNTDSDSWKLSADLSLGTNDVIAVTTAGAVTFSNTSSNVTINSAANGVSTGLVINNTSNTASSGALLQINTAGTSGGRQVLQFINTTDTVFSISKTSSTNAPLIFSAGNPGTNDNLTITSSGEITNALQPAFLAYLASTVTNVTGTGTEFTLGTTTALTEVFDQGSDFVTSGTFTAPVTGRYFLQMRVTLTGCTVATTFNCRINTSNRSYNMTFQKAAGTQDETIMLDTLADMDSADTATAIVSVSGEAGDTVDVNGAATLNTAFSGYLAC